MKNFWSNIYRYPTFFISSIVGLIFVIITPFKNLIAIERFKFVLPFLIILIAVFIYLTIINMSGL